MEQSCGFIQCLAQFSHNSLLKWISFARESGIKSIYPRGSFPASTNNHPLARSHLRIIYSCRTALRGCRWKSEHLERSQADTGRLLSSTERAGIVPTIIIMDWNYIAPFWGHPYRFTVEMWFIHTLVAVSYHHQCSHGCRGADWWNGPSDHQTFTSIPSNDGVLPKDTVTETGLERRSDQRQPFGQ